MLIKVPISHTSSLAQTTKIVHLQRIWFSFLAFHNNRWIARLFTVASHKLPVSKLLYYLWNRKITKKYPSWLLPAGEPLPGKLFKQICIWEQRSPPLRASFGTVFTIVCFTIYCDPVVSRYFLHPDIYSWVKVSVNVWRSEGDYKQKHACTLQRSAMTKKCVKPFCFTASMMNAMLLMWY